MEKTILKKKTDKITIQGTNVVFQFTTQGDTYEISQGSIMLNQLNGNTLDGSLNQLYLRVHTDQGILVQPMIGSNSDSTFSTGDQGVQWSGTFQKITYSVTFQLAETDEWYWTVTLKGSGQQVDVLYGQDLGNASKGALQANEAYISQYLDHRVIETEQGYAISSRQNQPQNGSFPLIEQGSLTKTVGFSTDGYQFFGKEYKTTNTPKALNEISLANEVYQYEFAYIAFQTEKTELREEETATHVFYGRTKKSQETAVDQLITPLDVLRIRYEKLEKIKSFDKQKPVNKSIGTPIIGEEMTEAEINELFPKRLQEEMEQGRLLSFFTDEYHHIVTRSKEEQMERATGHILLSGKEVTVDEPLMSSTVYMYGIFNSQIVLGNTSMNKLMSNSRNSLNTLKNSGQRIYIKKEKEWHLLTMPSLFEMGLNSATWTYKLADDVLKITAFSVSDPREIRLQFVSEKQVPYTLAVTNHLLMNDSEVPAFELTKAGRTISVQATEASVISKEYPDLRYYIHLDRPFEVTDEELFGINDSQELQIILIEEQSAFELTIQGSLGGEPFQQIDTTLAEEDQSYRAYIDELLNHFRLEHSDPEAESINLLARWYAHNALVHYLSPHGLEQYGGAAWGTRDVSQGPVEFFFAVNKPEVVKEIIKKVYANQFSDLGNWPQWFMFDHYEKIKSDESHGDVIVWPMKVLADYIEKTGDGSILQEIIPYTDRETFGKHNDSSLFDHLKKEIEYIETNFLEGTYLSCYGDGDWDDTLQPNDASMKKNMASSWTVALTYQVVKKLSAVLKAEAPEYAEHLFTLSQNIKADFEKYMLSTEVIPGFVYMENGEPEWMIHPTDNKTGIHYRLLPMTRSIIAELLTPEKAQSHLALIKEHLQFPDGVHLMNRPAQYKGGVSTHFKRAEQAANFGREIGLQYVHAHIRFTEAMAKLGERSETWDALQLINPIQIKKHVPHASIRQSNVYFSSSDGDFKTRYEAQEHFDRLKNGSVNVKGGWRIYSSGPGIYLNQLISNVLGVRESENVITLDPVLPVQLDGMTMHYKILGKNVKITFKLSNHNEKNVLIDGVEIPYSLADNPYRDGGIVMEKTAVEKQLKENSEVSIFC